MANLSSTDKPIVEELLANFYQTIKPYLGGTTYVSGFTPVGTIISVMATAAPQHYLACDGTAYSISDYPELAEHIKSNFGSYNFFGGNGTTTFAVPDLRGEFLRGTGTNSHSNQGSGSNVGTHQDATQHMGVWANVSANTIALNLESGEANFPIGENFDSSISRGSYIATDPLFSEAFVSTFPARYMSRPTNTSVLYCIATKDIYVDARQDYSTTEKVVGTWVDGKPIYQKTIDCGVLPNATTKTIAHNISNIDYITEIVAVAKRSSKNGFMPLCYVYPITSGVGFAIIGVSATEITLRGNEDLSSYDVCYATLKYTKTTD